MSVNQHKEMENNRSNNGEEHAEKSAPKRRSEVWDHFTLNKVTKRAICNHCKEDLQGDSKKGTSHLKRHLLNFHPREYAAFQTEESVLSVQRNTESVARCFGDKNRTPLTGEEAHLVEKRARLNKEKQLKRPINEPGLNAGGAILIGEKNNMIVQNPHVQLGLQNQNGSTLEFGGAFKNFLTEYLHLIEHKQQQDVQIKELKEALDRAKAEIAQLSMYQFAAFGGEELVLSVGRNKECVAPSSGDRKRVALTGEEKEDDHLMVKRARLNREKQLKRPSEESGLNAEGAILIGEKINKNRVPLTWKEREDDHLVEKRACLFLAGQHMKGPILAEVSVLIDKNNMTLQLLLQFGLLKRYYSTSESREAIISLMTEYLRLIEQEEQQQEAQIKELKEAPDRAKAEIGEEKDSEERDALQNEKPGWKDYREDRFIKMFKKHCRFVRCDLLASIVIKVEDLNNLPLPERHPSLAVSLNELICTGLRSPSPVNDQDFEEMF